MADFNHESVWPFKSASAVGAFLPVFQNIASPADDTVVLAPTHGVDVIGLTIATVASAGDEVAVVTRGKAKAIAAASVGAGALVGVASPNGHLGPLAAAGVASGAPAGQPVRHAVGRTLRSHAEGDVMTILLDPGQIV